MIILGNLQIGHMGYSSGSTVETWQYGANSAGGVALRFTYKNDTEKTIKYAYFTVVPYNAVKDKVSCTVKRVSEQTVKITGPIEPNIHRTPRWENLWYNNTIRTVELKEIEIEYMDGSKEILKGGEIQYEEITEADLEEMQEMLEKSLEEALEVEKALKEKRALEEIQKSGGCYVATAVYGSYDCPQVWTLRRFRDNTLAETWYGRAFIRAYYAVSPALVRWFGETRWFQTLWRGPLDRLVARLRSEGVEDTPYQDRDW